MLLRPEGVLFNEFAWILQVLNSSEGTSAYMDDDLIDIEALFEDDVFMPTATS